jgi:hypothetical protein
MHICTDCGCENNNTHSTSLCRECQLVLMLNLADDSKKSAEHRVQWMGLLSRISKWFGAIAHH